MTREDALALINTIVDPIDALTENTIIAESDDIDSLSLLTIFTAFKKKGIDCKITDFIGCSSVGEIITLVTKE